MGFYSLNGPSLKTFKTVSLVWYWSLVKPSQLMFGRLDKTFQQHMFYVITVLAFWKILSVKFRKAQKILTHLKCVSWPWWKFFTSVTVLARVGFYNQNDKKVTSGNEVINSWIFAAFAAFSICSWVTSLRKSPYAMLSRIEHLNKTGSWETIPTWRRSHGTLRDLISSPSIVFKNKKVC